MENSLKVLCIQVKLCENGILGALPMYSFMQRSYHFVLSHFQKLCDGAGWYPSYTVISRVNFAAEPCIHAGSVWELYHLSSTEVHGIILSWSHFNIGATKNLSEDFYHISSSSIQGTSYLCLGAIWKWQQTKMKWSNLGFNQSSSQYPSHNHVLEIISEQCNALRLVSMYPVRV